MSPEALCRWCRCPASLHNISGRCISPHCLGAGGTGKCPRWEAELKTFDHDVYEIPEHRPLIERAVAIKKIQDILDGFMHDESYDDDLRHEGYMDGLTEAIRILESAPEEFTPGPFA